MGMNPIMSAPSWKVVSFVVLKSDGMNETTCGLWTGDNLH